MTPSCIFSIAAISIFALPAVSNAQSNESDELQRGQLVSCINIENNTHYEVFDALAGAIAEVENYRHINTKLKIISANHHMVLMSFENDNAFGNLAQNIALAVSRNDNCAVEKFEISREVHFRPPDEFYEGFVDVSELVIQE